MRRRTALILAAAVVAIPSPLVPLAPCRGEDWPQWQGPTRDNVSAEKGLLKTWPKAGPKLLWTAKDAGLGYSGPAVVGERLYTLGARDKTTYLLCYSVKDG